ncbi:MAG: hypothetical protein ACW98K_15320 [Candidatus Kariarchaeaceae archaeon]|jgi:hypothetical protein
MLRIAYGKFKLGRGFEFIEWFRNKENVRAFQDSLPEGVEFLDAYLVDGGQADHHFELVYRMRGYAVLDNWTMANEKVKSTMQKFLLDLGFYAETFQVKYLKTVDEVTQLDHDVFKEIMAKEKERSH